MLNAHSEISHGRPGGYEIINPKARLDSAAARYRVINPKSNAPSGQDNRPRQFDLDAPIQDRAPKGRANMEYRDDIPTRPTPFRPYVPKASESASDRETTPPPTPKYPLPEYIDPAAKQLDTPEGLGIDNDGNPVFPRKKAEPFLSDLKQYLPKTEKPPVPPQPYYAKPIDRTASTVRPAKKQKLAAMDWSDNKGGAEEIHVEIDDSQYILDQEIPITIDHQEFEDSRRRQAVNRGSKINWAEIYQKIGNGQAAPLPTTENKPKARTLTPPPPRTQPRTWVNESELPPVLNMDNRELLASISPTESVRYTPPRETLPPNIAGNNTERPVVKPGKTSESISVPAPASRLGSIKPEEIKPPGLFSSLKKKIVKYVLAATGIITATLGGGYIGSKSVNDASPETRPVQAASGDLAKPTSQGTNLNKTATPDKKPSAKTAYTLGTETQAWQGYSDFWKKNQMFDMAKDMKSVAKAISISSADGKEPSVKTIVDGMAEEAQRDLYTPGFKNYMKSIKSAFQIAEKAVNEKRASSIEKFLELPEYQSNAGRFYKVIAATPKEAHEDNPSKVWGIKVDSKSNADISNVIKYYEKQGLTGLAEVVRETFEEFKIRDNEGKLEHNYVFSSQHKALDAFYKVLRSKGEAARHKGNGAFIIIPGLIDNARKDHRSPLRAALSLEAKPIQLAPADPANPKDKSLDPYDNTETKMSPPKAAERSTIHGSIAPTQGRKLMTQQDLDIYEIDRNW